MAIGNVNLKKILRKFVSGNPEDPETCAVKKQNS